MKERDVGQAAGREMQTEFWWETWRKETTWKT